MRDSAFNDDNATSSEGSDITDMAAVVKSLAGATTGITSADGIVLVLPGSGLPRVSGWFNSNASPGFTATVRGVVREAMFQAGSATAPGVPFDRVQRTAWNRIRVGSGSDLVGEVWLYRSSRRAMRNGLTTVWDQSSPAVSPALTHLTRWQQNPPGRDALLWLQGFAQSVTASPDLERVCASAVHGFKAGIGATATEIELFERGQSAGPSASSGPTPIRDGTHEGRLQSPEDDDRLGPVVDWFFDVFPLTSADGTPLGAVTCYWHEGSTAENMSLPLVKLMLDLVSASVERARFTHHAASVRWAAAAAIADAVDARDSYTRHHARRVAWYSRQIAEQMALPPAEAGIIETAGLLHDIGKIGVPDRVLQASGTLDDDDWDLIRRHPELGASIAMGFPDLAGVAPLIRSHHERYDGTGYPSGLKGEDIPLGARIIAIVEAFDTLVTGRPYQPPWTVERSLTTLESLGDQQFDRDIVGVFSLAIRNGSIRAEVPPPVKTGDLDLHRWIGADARAFALLQRIGNEVGELIDIRRFLARLREIIQAEFPDSMIDIFIRDREHDHLTAIRDGSSQKLEQVGVYVMEPNSGIVGWVARNGRTQNIADVLEDPRYIVPDDGAKRSELAVPMLLDNACVGVLNLESPEMSAYSRTDEKVLETIASYVARAIQVAELHSKVKQESDIDSMTGLLNHRAFYRTLEIEVDRASRTGDVLSVAIIDVDDFKLVNDSKGHVWGDVVLRQLAAILSGSVRLGDAVARYGGDEFSIIMPGASREVLEQRMREIEEELRVESEKSPLPRISWGIASFPVDGARPTELVARADEAMYVVKQQSST